MDWIHRVQIVKEKVKGAGHDWGAGNLAATLSLSLEAARALDTLPRRSCSCIYVRRKINTFFFFLHIAKGMEVAEEDWSCLPRLLIS